MPAKSLLRALIDSGAGSRRRIADAIRQGNVIVNGATAEDFNHQIDPAKDRVTINGQPVNLQTEESICLMLHKPGGVFSTTRDERGRRTVLDLLPDEYKNVRLYPAGRLDKDSTGLLLLTNDGNLTYQLTHPKFEHEKEYLVQIDGKLKPGEKERLEHGIELDDGMTHNAKIQEVTSSSPFNYSITIHEGRKRQVRRMFESCGYRVTALKRVRIGNLSLGNLKEGHTRRLNSRELRLLLDNRP